ncbi:MAG: nucleocapsid [Nanning Rhabd tick virus 1]|uniref:Nucleoprotein n=1 Tax=Nanning Rhabd tick virus 1 TaxID=2972321 RepID=A0A9E7V281_9RHAB|nr:MAG: nucleocapsid [Nanning Rhabd tick virus 1]
MAQQGRSRNNENAEEDLIPVLFDTSNTYRMYHEQAEDKVPPEYPSAWFDDKKSKPILNCYTFTMSGADLRKTIHGGLVSGELPPDYAVAFLVSVAPQITTTLPHKLESFGQLIGEENAQINPLSLLAVNRQDWSGDMPQCQVRDNPSPDMAMVAAIGMIYRLCVSKARGGTDAYIISLRERFTDLISNPPARANCKYLDDWASFSSWTSHRDIQVILAAYDMLLYIDGNHEYGIIRAGTLVCRGRDCAVLGDLQRAGKALGKAPSEVYYWCFSAALFPELSILAIRDQELGNPYSYYHYMSPMALSKRSPYSASMCPGVHLLTNAVAALLGIEEAQNTRYVSCDSPQAILTNAVITAYAYRQGTGFRLMVARGFEAARAAQEELKAELQKGREDAPLDPETIPTSIEPGDWTQYMSMRDWLLPTDIVEWAKGRVTNFRNVRSGSVAEFVRNRFGQPE